MKKIISAIIIGLAMFYILCVVGECEMDAITIGETMFRTGIAFIVVFVAGHVGNLFEK